MKESKEKTGAKKTIKGKMHVCFYGPAVDPRYVKCYFCPSIKVK